MKVLSWIILFSLMFISPGAQFHFVLASSQDPEIQAELQAAKTHSSKADLPTAIKESSPISSASVLGAVIYSSDFESDNGGMTGSLDWTWDTYRWVGDGCYDGSTSGPNPPPSAHSGFKMWGTKLNTCYDNLGNNATYSTCTNDNSIDDSILSFSVDLTGFSKAHLRWWEWYDLFGPFDWAEVSVNGVVVFQHCDSGFVQPTEWVEQVVDLTPFVGGRVVVEFHMMASTVVNFSGWFIDDVSVREGTGRKGKPWLFLLFSGDEE